MKVMCGASPFDSRGPVTSECCRKPVTHCSACSSVSFNSGLHLAFKSLHLIKVKFSYKISSIRSLFIYKFFLVLVCFEVGSSYIFYIVLAGMKRPVLFSCCSDRIPSGRQGLYWLTFQSQSVMVGELRQQGEENSGSHAQLTFFLIFSPALRSSPWNDAAYSENRSSHLTWPNQDRPPQACPKPLSLVALDPTKLTGSINHHTPYMDWTGLELSNPPFCSSLLLGWCAPHLAI